jgi:dTMP kinase
MQRAGAAPDRIEREGEAFRRAVREGYLALAESEGNVEVIDARGTPEDVHERLRARVAARLSQASSGGAVFSRQRVGEGG